MSCETLGASPSAMKPIKKCERRHQCGKQRGAARTEQKHGAGKQKHRAGAGE